MRFNSGQEFIDSANKTIVFIGMSGVGKTFTANLLPKDQWSRYSVDYHIGANYLYQDIAENFTDKAGDNSVGTLHFGADFGLGKHSGRGLGFHGVDKG